MSTEYFAVPYPDGNHRGSQMQLAFGEPGTTSSSELHKVIRRLLYRPDHNTASNSTLRNIVLVPYGFFDINFLP